MILDNLSRAFRNQNRLAAGVVIGFLINAWAERRAPRRLEGVIALKIERRALRSF